MKRVLIFIFSMASVQMLMAQKVQPQDVPTEVKSALARAHSANNVRWSREDGNYEASFRKEGKEISLVIDPTGNVIETETEITKADLPAGALQLIQEQYADHRLNESARIEASGVVTYEAEVGKGERSFDLIFDAAGKLLSKKANEDRD